MHAQTGYNLYAIDRLDAEQILDLSRQMETGMDLRFGGNEYVTSDIPFENALHLSDLMGGGKISVSIVRTKVYADADRILGDMFGHVTYGNEPWLKLNPWSDILSWIFNKRGFYTNAARQYMKDAEAFANATGSDPVVNVPLPQNPFLQAWLDEVSKWKPKVVSIHVYGKPWEVGYYEKLEGWLKQITDRFERVIVGEFNGIALHVKPEYKDTEQARLSEARILELFEKYGIEEVYYFTLVATSDMMKWRNAPVYPKYVIE